MNDQHDCHQILGSLMDYFDGTLPEELCAELEAHLCECQNCQIVVNTTRKTIELYQTAAKEEGAIPAAVRSRLFTRLNLDDYRP
ncbi:MAG: anti-sigma factor [Chloroflexi bacterium]|jgi:predicted anti-sigma-YlaC factor YlaD|nr:zf-HC2 domain-containing protein [Anaerolineaceae bacterium]NMB86802.1 anti-sigma factor [Chloroflexota bacterium]